MELQVGMLQLQAKEHRGKEGFFSRPFRGSMALPVPSFWTSALQTCCIKPPKLYGSPGKLIYRLFIDGIHLPLTHLHVARSEVLAQILFHRLSTFPRVSSSGNRAPASLRRPNSRVVTDVSRGIGPAAEGLDWAEKLRAGWRRVRGGGGGGGEGRREAAGRSRPGEGARRARGTHPEEEAPCPGLRGG